MSVVLDSRSRILAALEHRTADRIPFDMGGTLVTGIHVSCVAALRRHYGLDGGPVKAIDPGRCSARSRRISSRSSESIPRRCECA